MGFSRRCARDSRALVTVASASTGFILSEIFAGVCAHVPVGGRLPPAVRWQHHSYPHVACRACAQLYHARIRALSSAAADTAELPNFDACAAQSAALEQILDPDRNSSEATRQLAALLGVDTGEGSSGVLAIAHTLVRAMQTSFGSGVLTDATLELLSALKSDGGGEEAVSLVQVGQALTSVLSRLGYGWLESRVEAGRFLLEEALLSQQDIVSKLARVAAFVQGRVSAHYHPVVEAALRFLKVRGVAANACLRRRTRTRAHATPP